MIVTLSVHGLDKVIIETLCHQYKAGPADTSLVGNLPLVAKLIILHPYIPETNNGKFHIQSGTSPLQRFRVKNVNRIKMLRSQHYLY